MRATLAVPSGFCQSATSRQSRVEYREARTYNELYQVAGLIVRKYFEHPDKLVPANDEATRLKMVATLNSYRVFGAYPPGSLEPRVTMSVVTQPILPMDHCFGDRLRQFRNGRVREVGKLAGTFSLRFIATVLCKFAPDTDVFVSTVNECHLEHYMTFWGFNLLTPEPRACGSANGAPGYGLYARAADIMNHPACRRVRQQQFS